MNIISLEGSGAAVRWLKECITNNLVCPKRRYGLTSCQLCGKGTVCFRISLLMAQQTISNGSQKCKEILSQLR
ncbi:unnamed protein product [Trifolium pratense]|uniref:Uncharacterized protein n=1 Tax=Trifolium pratense TaxID=57577 RepID=A0ACB0I6H7_TRIPR|nr:unnamed protein product [Trifolium pratense]